MGLYKEGCGHPSAWVYRLVFNSRVYTYCAGCIIEKLGLENLESYENPFIKVDTPQKKKTETKKVKVEVNENSKTDL